MVQTAEHGRIRFESPEVGVRSQQREERGGKDCTLELRVDGQAGILFLPLRGKSCPEKIETVSRH